MPITAAVPYRINARGGLATTNRPLPELVASSVEPGDSLNPFSIRDGAAGDSIVWAATDNQLDQLVRARIMQRFNALEIQGRARLLSITKQHDNEARDGKAVFVVEWQDLETGDADEAVRETRIGGSRG